MTTALTETPCDQDSLVQELREIVGAEFVSAEPTVLGRWGRTTLPAGDCPILLARPAGTREVQRLVRWAGRHQVPVYPISCGKNWGYGDACPPRAGCLLIDLSRMNRIREVNAELAYAVVEPGVTQGQLYQHLEEHGIPLWMDATGAGPDSSIVGNILERGVGLSPYSDRFAHACALEVVLPDGRLLRTGFGAYDNAQAEHLYSYGCGPVLDGLFSQANLGIVTRLTFWLMPKPASFSAFFIRLQQREDIGALIEVLRPLRLAGTIRCSVHCFNDLRLLGSQTRFPWERADGRQALEVCQPELTRELLARYQLPAWLASGSLAGTPLEVAAARKVLGQALRPVKSAKLNFVDTRTLARIHWLRRHLPRWQWMQSLRRRLDQVAMWTEFLQGQTSHKTLTGSHWRARGQPGPDQNPLDSGAGLIWICPVLPMTDRAVAEVSRIGEACFHRFGFEFQVTLSQVSDRALCAVLSIHFDRRNLEESERAGACHDALVRELLQHGYPPYRGAPRTVDLLHQAGPVYWDVARRLKQALDPDELIAPGRYIPSERTITP